MAKTGKKQLRGAWLQVHKWIGLALGLLIIPIALTGSALVWHDWVDAKLEPQRYATIGPATLAPDFYADAARSVLSEDQAVASMRFDAGGAPVVVTAIEAPGEAGGAPARTSVWIDPATGRVIDKMTGNDSVVRILHVLHGRLMMQDVGRTIVGWVGVFMLVSTISGLWLWWPLSGSVRRGFRWNRRNSVNANLHYQMGYWILIPLAMLSFTGAWISFPKVFGRFEPAATAAPAPAPARQPAMPAHPLEQTATSSSAALAASAPLATGNLVSITWPTDQKAEWKVSYEREGGPAEVVVADQSGAVTPPSAPKPETLARTMRRWHDGTGMGLGWQIIIFLGGIVPAALSVTGTIIWWRSRRPRQRARDRQRLETSTP